MRAFRRRYGSGPGHLAALLFCFTLTGYAAYSIFHNARPWSVVLWLVGAIVVHDFVVLPLYTGAYRLAWRVGHVARDKRRRVPVIHHVAVPALLSGLLFMTWLPLILRLSEPGYRATTGMSQEPYLWRWLGVTGALFAASALVYGLRAGRLRRAPVAEGGERAGDEPAQGAS